LKTLLKIAVLWSLSASALFVGAQADVFTIQGGQISAGSSNSFAVYFRDVSGTPIDTGTAGMGAFRMTFDAPGDLIESATFQRAGLLENASILIEDQEFDPDADFLQWSVALSFDPPPFNLDAPAPGDLIGFLTIQARASAQGQTIELTPLTGASQFFVQDELGVFEESFAEGNLTGNFSPISVLSAGGGDPPFIEEFTANPATIASGASSTLSWSVIRADNVTIDQGIGAVTANATRTVSPAETTVYTLTASNEHGTVTDTVTVNVQTGGGGDPPTIQFFNVEPNSIVEGESATLSWNVQGAQTVSLDQGIGEVGPSSVRTVSPVETTVYTLTAVNQFGSVSRTVTLAVGVTELTIDSFTADPSLLDAGDSTTLSWLVLNADTVEIEPDVGLVQPSDSETIVPAETTTYTLTARRGLESVAATTTVFVRPLPKVVSFVADPPEIGPGGNVILSWETADATQANLSRTVNGQTVQFGRVDLTGSANFQPSETTLYTLVATRDDKSDMASVEVRVIADALVIEPTALAFGLDLSQLDLTLANEVDRDLDWSVVGAPDWLALEPQSGTVAAAPQTLTATVDRDLLAPGLNEGVIQFEAGGQSYQAMVSAEAPLGDAEFAFPLLRADDLYRSEFGLVNLESETLTFVLEVFNGDGSPAAPPQELSLAPLATHQAAAPQLGQGSGWARIIVPERPEANLGGYANIFSMDGEELYAYGLARPDHGRIVAPHVARDVNFFTSGSLVNLAETLDMFAFDASGEQFPIGNLAAGQQAIFDFRDELMGGEVRGNGWGDLLAGDAATPMTAVEVFGRAAQTGLRQTVAVGLDDQSANQLIFPHLAANTEIFWTGVVVINLGAETATATYQIYNAAGETIAGRDPEPLASGEKKTYLMDANTQAFGQGAAWLTVSADQPLAGYMLFGSFAPDDRFSGFQSVKAGATGLCFPYLDLSTQPEGYTGIALVNLSDEDGSVMLQLVDQSGVVKAQRTEPLAKKQKFIALARDLFAADILNGDKIIALGTTSLAGFEIFGLGAKTLGGILALTYGGD